MPIRGGFHRRLDLISRSEADLRQKPRGKQSGFLSDLGVDMRSEKECSHRCRSEKSEKRVAAEDTDVQWRILQQPADLDWNSKGRLREVLLFGHHRRTTEKRFREKGVDQPTGTAVGTCICRGGRREIGSREQQAQDQSRSVPICDWQIPAELRGTANSMPWREGRPSNRKKTQSHAAGGVTTNQRRSGARVEVPRQHR